MRSSLLYDNKVRKGALLLTLSCLSVSFHFILNVGELEVTLKSNEPRCEKTDLRGFRPGPTQTGLYSHREWLEA